MIKKSTLGALLLYCYLMNKHSQPLISITLKYWHQIQKNHQYLVILLVSVAYP
jgi:hypothetical protein